MSKNSLCYELQSVQCPAIETPVYQSCLQQVLEVQDKGKRDKLVSSLESFIEVVATNRFIVSSFGVTFTLVILFVVALNPSSQHAPSKVQAADVISDMELATSRMQPAEILAMEEKLQMSFEDMMEQVRNARSRMVYDLDPRVPMRVVDTRDASVETHVVFFTQDPTSGRLSGQVMHMNAIPADSTESAFGTRRIFQYSSEDGNIVMLELSEENIPESSIVLAAN